MVEGDSYDLVLHKDANPRTGGVAICGFSSFIENAINH